MKQRLRAGCRMSLSLLLFSLLPAQAQDRPLLGVRSVDMPGNAGVTGALVQLVTPHLPASLAGLRANDVIIAVDRTRIASASDLVAAITSHDAADTVRLRVLRSGAEFTVSVTLNTRQPANEPPPSGNRAADATAAANAPPVSWVTFTDPHEHAFQTDVPRGWRVTGGLLRHTVVDPSIFLRMISPDRHTFLIFGDPKLTLFSTPVRQVTPFRMATAPNVLQYMGGTTFVQTYLARALPALCTHFTVDGQRERPDIAQKMAAVTNPDAHHDGGEANFTCLHNGMPARGQFVADTFIYPTPGSFGGSLWTADLLAGFIAQPEDFATASDMVKHVLTGFRFDPDWLQRQAATTRQVAQGIDRTTQQNIQQYERFNADIRGRSAQMSQQEDEFDRILTGRSPYTDPTTGNTHDLDNTKTQWMNSNGRTMGTTGASPGAGWTRLPEDPPQ